MTSTLFNWQGVEEYFKQFWQSLKPEIDRIPAGEIVLLDAEQYGTEMAAKYLVECPVLGTDIEAEEPPFSPGRTDFELTVRVPFTGDPDLFKYHASYRPIIMEHVRVEPGRLTITLRTSTQALPQFQKTVMALLERIETGLAPIREELKHRGPQLARQAVSRIKERQGELASHAALLNQVKSIGFPLRKREDAKESLIVPVKQRPVEVRPKPTAAKPAPEPELSLADYDTVLQVIQDMVKVFERSPTVFKGMKEEDFRTILLVALNGLFKGGATAETFNGAGKTDILIRVDNNNIFIAECLMWKGPEYFKGKLTEQLFNYSTWRDSKLCAIVFNQKKDFSSVVQKMRDVVKELPNCEAPMPYSMDTGCRHRFHRQDDSDKKFVLTCLAFEVPSV